MFFSVVSSSLSLLSFYMHSSALQHRTRSQEPSGYGRNLTPANSGPLSSTSAVSLFKDFPARFSVSTPPSSKKKSSSLQFLGRSPWEEERSRSSGSRTRRIVRSLSANEGTACWRRPTSCLCCATPRSRSSSSRAEAGSSSMRTTSE